MPRFILIVFLIILLLALSTSAGCLPSPATSGQTETTMPTTSVSAPSQTETTAPTGPTTSGGTISTTGSETGATEPEPTGTEAEPEIYFHPLPARETLLIDLNDDGYSETILYDSYNSYSFVFLFDGAATQFEGENFLDGWFFLVDLDSNDSFLDLAVQELGPSDDFQVSFFYFDGSRLIKRGTVPGTICDPFAANIGAQAYGLGSIRLDGFGGLIAEARGAVLHTWFYDEPWVLDSRGQLQIIPQTYVPMTGLDPLTGLQVAETPVVMKINLPLYPQPSVTSASLIARTGENASLVRTDNSRWVELRTQSGETGWFRLGANPYSVQVGASEYFSEEVFSGLTFAD